MKEKKLDTLISIRVTFEEYNQFKLIKYRSKKVRSFLRSLYITEVLTKNDILTDPKKGSVAFLH